MHRYIVRLAGAFSFAILSLLPAHALDSNVRKAMLDSLSGQLSIAMTAADSIEPLYNIFDLTYGSSRIELANTIYSKAKQTGRTKTQLDMLRHIANLNWKNDTVLHFVKKEIEKLPESVDQKSTKLFVDIINIDNLLWSEHNKNNNDHLLNYVRQYSSESVSDDYDRAVLLYAVCRYLGQETRGELLEGYIGRLEELIESMHLPDGAVRRLLYTRSAPIFYKNDNYKRVLEADTKMLHEIDSLESNYTEQGRVFYNAPIYRYKSYRRMLGCYPVLSEEEIEDYYGKILYLADINPNIAFDLKTNERASIYYAMATGDYQKAKTMLKRQIDDPIHAEIRLQLLRMLQEAASKTNDTNTLLESSQLLSEELENQLETKKQERSRELQLVYDLSDLLHRNSQLEAYSHSIALKSRTVMIIIGAITIILLVILSLLLFRQNKRNRKLADILRNSNDSLRQERDDLRATQEELTTLRDKARAADRKKTEFINNMSHEVKVPLTAIAEYSQLITDCIPENQRAYLDRFSSIINSNVKMVIRLVNDVLDTDSMENGQMSLEIRPTTVESICRLAIDNVFERGIPDKEGLKFCYKPGGSDELTIETDGQRVSQVLVNLPTNAVKFSDTGLITLSYDYNEADGKISFIVTDQGEGIPNGQEEAIFERFRRLDHSAHGCGLGLYISRLIAKLLKGTVTVDKSYKGGARFVFTIPTVS